jgi:hypothetical protein
LGGFVIEAVLALEFAGDRRAQFGNALDGGVFVSPRRMAAMAASLILSGVSKSGSPAPSPMTSRPANFRSRAFCDTAIVGEGWMRFNASDRNPLGSAAADVTVSIPFD